jgi:1,4-dihydroxy-2-naphthoate octaprenyltransferase
MVDNLMTDVPIHLAAQDEQIQSTFLQKLQIWIFALRAPFFTASIVPLILGMAIAYYETASFDFILGLLTLVSGVAIQAGTNLANDYYDRSTDDINIYYSQFNGGSRMIQNEIISPRNIRLAAIMSYIVGSVTALLILFMIQGYLLVVFLSIAVLLGFFYTALPVSLSYHGLGELAVFVGFGPLGVYSAYYIQLGHINSNFLSLASIPIALLIALVLFLNEFQDLEADAKAGKNTLVVTLGKKRSVKIYSIGMILSYLVVIIFVIFFGFPLITLLPLITLPIAIKAVTHANKYYDKIKELLPANGQTVLVHFVFGILLSLAFVIA